MSKIIITDPVRLREIIEFAEQNRCTDQLGRSVLRVLHLLCMGMTNDNDRSSELGTDFAPLSMSFVIRDAGRLVLTGGWIYAGPGAPGDGSFPSLTVDLESIAGRRETHSWNCHT